MPENPNLLQKIRSSLRLKLSAIVIILSLSATLLASLINFNQIYLPLLPIPILCSAVGVFLIFFLLKPLEDIYHSSKLLSKGEYKTRVNITTGDELEEIGKELNKLADNISGSSQDSSLETMKLNSIISSLTDGIIVLDLNKKVVLSNKAAEGITGYSSEQMKGQSIDTLIIIQNKDGSQIYSKDFCPTISDPNYPVTFQSPDTLNLIGNNKTSRTVKFSVSAIHQSPQTDLGFILDFEDRSKEKELEAIQLDFVSMASHELRTPLTSIRGYMSVFMNENKAKLAKEQVEPLEKIQVSADQLAAIIDNLLSVSKVERGAFSVTAQTLDYQKLLEKVVEDNKLQAASKNISLKLILPETLPQISADSVRISEVLNNLIGNAINYTPEGGSIEVEAKTQGQEMLTSVKDTGIGIPEEALGHLFTKFFRVQGALDQSSNSKGTGLGLYISKSIIDLHHGKIWAESKIGQGSTFSFTLPLPK